MLWDLLDRIEELRGYIYTFSQEFADEGRWLDDWGKDEVHEFLFTLSPEEDAKLRRELHAWFTQEVSYEEEGGNDIVRPIDGRRFAFEFFAYGVDGDLLDALDICIIEGDQPGSNYRGAEMKGSFENAQRLVRERDLPFTFERLAHADDDRIEIHENTRAARCPTGNDGSINAFFDALSDPYCQLAVTYLRQDGAHGIRKGIVRIPRRAKRSFVDGTVPRKGRAKAPFLWSR